MRPDVDHPARALTRLECRMHALMEELVARGDLEAARSCRVELAGVSARRAEAARVELAVAA